MATNPEDDHLAYGVDHGNQGSSRTSGTHSGILGEVHNRFHSWRTGAKPVSVLRLSNLCGGTLSRGLARGRHLNNKLCINNNTVSDSSAGIPG